MGRKGHNYPSFPALFTHSVLTNQVNKRLDINESTRWGIVCDDLVARSTQTAVSIQRRIVTTQVPRTLFLSTLAVLSRLKFAGVGRKRTLSSILKGIPAFIGCYKRATNAKRGIPGANSISSTNFHFDFCKIHFLPTQTQGSKCKERWQAHMRHLCRGLLLNGCSVRINEQLPVKAGRHVSFTSLNEQSWIPHTDIPFRTKLTIAKR